MRYTENEKAKKDIDSRKGTSRLWNYEEIPQRTSQYWKNKVNRDVSYF